MKRLPVVLIVLSVSLFSQGAACSDGKTLVLLHTNDMHAQFLPKEALWVKETPRPMVGGFVRIRELADSIRAAAPATLLLDAGDVMTGNPITDRSYAGAEGGALFEMMNLIGYDAWSPGNHDFDISQENFRNLVTIARFPTLSANLRDDRGGFPVGNVPYAIFERGGVKIGVIGLMHPGLYNLVSQGNLKGIRVLDPAETAQKYIDEIDPQTDLILLLTHQGADLDSAMATELRNVDVIVGGHSHTRIRAPRNVNGILIVQTGSSSEALGVLELTVADDRVVESRGRLITTWVSGGANRADPPVSSGASASPAALRLTALADSMRVEIDREYSEVIGTLTADWRRGERQSPIGTFVAEAQRVAAGAEVGFMNTHGIRKDHPAGPISKKDLFEILPFRNLLVTFQLSGKELIGVVRHAIEKKSGIQIAGMNAEYRRRGDGTVEVVKAEVEGREIEPDRIYRCAASDYFVGESKGYLGLEISEPITLRQTVFAVVEKAIRGAGRVEPRVLYTIKEQP